ncbi:MAG: S8 family serine peptidase [Candidatus Eremiobacteraeota bacterium]|nr:S8 family serine peptidase [Candidatus Eremiobacteraeota bacterium]
MKITRQDKFPDLSGTPFEHITPQWAWGDSTGAGIKVAVIDSGIDRTHPALESSIAGGVDIRKTKNGIEHIEGDHTDAFGHGTACAGAIHMLAPEAEIYSVKVLGNTLTGGGDVFLKGIKWVIENKIPLANLSLGTTRDRYFAPLHSLIDSAYFKKLLMVAAQNNAPTPSFPAVFSSIIGVKAVDIEDPYQFYFNDYPPVEFLTKGVNVKLPWLKHGYETCTGNSFAAPFLTGIIARMLSKHPWLTPFMIKTILYSIAIQRGMFRKK